MRKIEFSATVRGVEITIHAEQFDGDPSVGIPYGPEAVYATREDNGEDFPLTDEEAGTFGIEAMESYYDWSEYD